MLKVYTRKLGDSYVLCLQGQMVAGATATLKEIVFGQIDAISLVLDFARVSRIDAAGLGLLLELREYSLSKNIDFKLMNVSGLVRRIFEISQLDSVFEILPERAETFRSVGQRPHTAFKLATCH